MQFQRDGSVAQQCGGRGGGWWEELPVNLTWTGLDASGSKAELLVRVVLGLEGDGVVDGGRRTVFLAHAAVVEVATRLQGDEGE